ncbi:hypothetical protein Ciccas_005981, partial [Cichlidogyrus casuarinus]
SFCIIRLASRNKLPNVSKNFTKPKESAAFYLFLLLTPSSATLTRFQSEYLVNVLPQDKTLTDLEAVGEAAVTLLDTELEEIDNGLVGFGHLDGVVSLVKLKTDLGFVEDANSQL